MRKNQF